MKPKPGDIRARAAAFLQREREWEKATSHPVIQRILSKDADGQYLVSDKEVMGLLFNDMPSSADAILAYLRIDGDPRILEDYGGDLLLQTGVRRPDGTADITVLDAWEARYHSALSVLPGLKSKLDAIREAHETLEKAKADKEAALDYIRKSPAMLFVEHDPMTATEKLFQLPDTLLAMQALLERINNDERALPGLRRAVVVYIQERVGVTDDRASHYVEFLAKHEAALAILFEKDKMQMLRNIALDLQRYVQAPEPTVAEVREHLYKEVLYKPTFRQPWWKRLFGI